MHVFHTIIFFPQHVNKHVTTLALAVRHHGNVEMCVDHTEEERYRHFLLYVSKFKRLKMITSEMMTLHFSNCLAGVYTPEPLTDWSWPTLTASLLFLYHWLAVQWLANVIFGQTEVAKFVEYSLWGLCSLRRLRLIHCSNMRHETLTNVKSLAGRAWKLISVSIFDKKTFVRGWVVSRL